MNFWEYCSTTPSISWEQRCLQKLANLRNQNVNAISSETKDAFFYFVRVFKDDLLKSYITYEQITNADTWWKQIKGNVSQYVLQQAVEEVASGAVQAIPDSTARVVAQGLAVPIVEAAFLLYKEANKKEKERLKKTAENYKTFASDRNNFLILTEEIAIALFFRFELLICALTRPDGLNQLITFFIESIEENMKNNKAVDGDKAQQLLRYAIPKRGDGCYYTLLHVAIKLEPSKPSASPWTLEGAIYRSLYWVVDEQVLYAYQAGKSDSAHWDAKYPLQYIATHQEANQMGLRSSYDLFHSANRNEQIIIFEELISFYEKRKDILTDSVSDNLAKMLLHLYENSRKKIDKKWAGYEQNLRALGINVSLPHPLSAPIRNTKIAKVIPVLIPISPKPRIVIAPAPPPISHPPKKSPDSLQVTPYRPGVFWSFVLRVGESVYDSSELHTNARWGSKPDVEKILTANRGNDEYLNAVDSSGRTPLDVANYFLPSGSEIATLIRAAGGVTRAELEQRPGPLPKTPGPN